MIPQHSSKTQEHYTPAHVVEAARACLGGIDLDPASCEEANRTVRATRYLTKADDGINPLCLWHGRVFLNPPGGRAGPGQISKSEATVWWDRLVKEYCANRVVSAVFVGFTLEILRTSQACGIPVQAFPRCYPRSRLEFRGSDPTHANVLVYLPPRDRASQCMGQFRAAFGELGLCEPGTESW